MFAHSVGLRVDDVLTGSRYIYIIAYTVHSPYQQILHCNEWKHQEKEVTDSPSLQSGL